MRIGLFSDVHYCRETVQEGNRRCALSFEKLKYALSDFQKRDISLLICMGDLCDVSLTGDAQENRMCLTRIMHEIRASGLDFLFITGNHDCLVAPVDELSRMIGQELAPKIVDTPEYRLICLDANFSSDGTHYDPAGFDWRDTNVPSDQLAFLKQSLADSDRECIVLIHEPVDSAPEECYRVNNAAEVRNILEASGKVKLVLQGHMHEYSDIVENGIRYMTVVGMCEGTDNYYMVLTKTGSVCQLEVIHIPESEMSAKPQENSL